MPEMDETDIQHFLDKAIAVEHSVETRTRTYTHTRTWID